MTCHLCEKKRYFLTRSIDVSSRSGHYQPCSDATSSTSTELLIELPYPCPGSNKCETILICFLTASSRSTVRELSISCFTNPKTNFSFYHAALYSTVGTATGYGLDGPGSIPGRGKTFLFSTASRPTLGPTQPPAGHSPPSSAEVKKGGATPSLPHMSS
jgi:hypothetical protein